jgi:hypothetical protein
VAVRKKILVVAGNLSHLDQFVIHGFFKELSESATVYLILPEKDLATERWAEVAKVLDDSITEVIPYEYKNVARKNGSQIGAALTFRFRKRSTGYRTRIAHKLLIGLEIPIQWKNGAGLEKLWQVKAEVIRRVIREVPSAVRGTILCFWFWSRIAVLRILKNCHLHLIFSELKPDSVLILMQRQAGFVVAAIDFANKLKIPSLLLPIKWDNSSSKSPLIKTPSRMLVYNRQIEDICLRLHKMKPNSVIAVGSVEIGKGKSSDISPELRSLVLIGSTPYPSSSEPWLHSVSEVLKAQEVQNLSAVKCVWRPYPTQMETSMAFMDSFIQSHSEIELDPDIRAGVSHRASGNSFDGASAAYAKYCVLLEAATIVVSECSSAIIDSRARGVPVIVPAFKKDAVIASQWSLLNGFEHLQGLRTTRGVFIAEDEQELERLLIDFLTNPRRIPPDNSGENIFVDERSYAQRVLDVVDEVIAEKLAKAG